MAYIGEQRLKELLTLIKGKFDAVKVSVSAESGNAIIEKSDGIYVANVQGVEVSADTGNAIEQKTDGLYVAEAAAEWNDLTGKPFSTLDTDDFEVDESGVLSVVVNNQEVVDTAYILNDTYSNEETIIGEWTNGKPIYRRVVTGVSMPQCATTGTVVYTDVDLSDANIDSAINIYGKCLVPSTNEQRSIPFLTFSSAYSVQLFYSPNKKSVRIGNSNTEYNGYSILYLIVEYTKTTDAEDSFDPSMLINKTQISSVPYYENYSSDEIIIGKWVDGKPLYRKTIVTSFSHTSGTPDNTVIDTIQNIDSFISITGGVSNSTSNSYLPINYMTPGAPNSCLTSYVTSAGEVTIRIGSDVSTQTFTSKVVIEYTKTTDAENSFTPDMLDNSTIAIGSEATDAELQEVFA